MAIPSVKRSCLKQPYDGSQKRIRKPRKQVSWDPYQYVISFVDEGHNEAKSLAQERRELLEQKINSLRNYKQSLITANFKLCAPKVDVLKEQTDALEIENIKLRRQIRIYKAKSNQCYSEEESLFCKICISCLVPILGWILAYFFYKKRTNVLENINNLGDKIAETDNEINKIKQKIDAFEKEKTEIIRKAEITNPEIDRLIHEMDFLKIQKRKIIEKTDISALLVDADKIISKPLEAQR